MTILQKALLEMSATFSSNEFAEKAKQLGYPDKLIKSGKLGQFLHRTCLQSPDSKRIWYKTQKANTELDFENDSLTKAIAIIKANGYRIMKQVTDWKEI